jgi:hypothetical protein
LLTLCHERKQRGINRFNAAQRRRAHAHSIALGSRPAPHLGSLPPLAAGPKAAAHAIRRRRRGVAVATDLIVIACAATGPGGGACIEGRMKTRPPAGLVGRRPAMAFGGVPASTWTISAITLGASR